MMVMRFLHDTDLGLKELTAVNAFTWGVAQPAHYHLLVDMVNMLVLAGSSDDTRTYAKVRAEQVYLPALQTIKARHEKTGKLGVTAKEQRLLKEMLDFSKAFWVRQPTELYAVAGRELKAFYAELDAKRRVKRKATA